MNQLIEEMIKKYNPTNQIEKINALKECLQEIVLLGLSRTDFFNRVSFYGGTCLRIFHGLDRFSEDLDFALIGEKEGFELESYFPAIEKELAAYGIKMEASSKIKEEAEILTGFVKGNTKMLMINFYPKDPSNESIINNQLIKIKLEIDLSNPQGGKSEIVYLLKPSPGRIRIFDESSLFAGKIHAILCRNYKSRVKGRDFYDYLFYIGKGTKVNIKYLENKLIHSSFMNSNETLTIAKLKSLLKKRFEEVDYESAKKDVINFVKNESSVSVWSKDLFLSTIDKIDEQL